MATVSRICPACGENTPLEARHCPHCGHDTQSGLPVQQGANLPAVVGKAAVPVLVTAGTIAARLLWRLLRERAATLAANGLQPTKAQPIVKNEPAPVAPSAGRRKSTIHIRSSWAVGDARGTWRSGQSEHHIEIEE